MRILWTIWQIITKLSKRQITTKMVKIFFDFQFGFMLQYGTTYRKEKYVCFCFPFFTVQIIKKKQMSNKELNDFLKKETWVNSRSQYGSYKGRKG